jgi:hypothetical protein
MRYPGFNRVWHSSSEDMHVPCQDLQVVLVLGSACIPNIFLRTWEVLKNGSLNRSSERLIPTGRIQAITQNYSKKLFTLNSSVMDDNYDTYKTANIEINQLFLERLINYLILRTSSYLWNIYFWPRYIEFAHLSALLRRSSRSYMSAYTFMSGILYATILDYFEIRWLISTLQAYLC